MLDILYSFVNGFLYFIAISLTFFFNLLPQSPFVFSLNVSSEWIKAICWLIPVPVLVAHLEVFCTSCVAYYCVRIVLRWLKAAKS